MVYNYIDILFLKKYNQSSCQTKSIKERNMRFKTFATGATLIFSTACGSDDRQVTTSREDPTIVASTPKGCPLVTLDTSKLPEIGIKQAGEDCRVVLRKGIFGSIKSEGCSALTVETIDGSTTFLTMPSGGQNCKVMVLK